MRNLLLITIVSLCWGCSLQRMAANQTAEILRDALPAFESEWDYELAAQAFPASLKTMEGFLRSAPDNPELLLLLARSYAAYALIVVEDAMQRAEAADDEAEAEHQRARAKALYLRAFRYGLRLMDQLLEGFSQAFGGDPELFDKAHLSRCRAEHVPALFWTGMALASAVNVARDDIMLIGKLPRARELMQRIVALDETYYFGGAHLVLGSLLGSAGPLTGGDTEASKRHFERALQLGGRRLLLVQEMYARTLAVQLQDQKLFEALLDEVDKADLSINPPQKLANVTAKRRARRLRARADELF